MKLGLSLLGLGARLAPWRIARSRDEAIRAALQSIAAQRQQQSDGNSNPPEKPSNPSHRKIEPRS
jgi:hypothetical protein